MKIEQFKSGKFKQQYQYKSFSPEPINHAWVWDNPKINTLLENATKALSELNAYSYGVPDIDLYISMHISKEAERSSKIEGTKTGMDEILMDKEYIDPEKRDDWQEVQNYIKAINYATKELKNLPLSSRLLLKTHKILMEGVRGKHKAPGEFRQSQNWIGGASLSDAVFIPPTHGEVPELISDLEKFWHNENIEVPQLIRIAISHYQFETIHPFLDGNGRMGRLLITLYLIHSGFLHKPCLYLSEYLEKHKGPYFDALTIARSSNDLAHWIKFFLIAINESAKKGQMILREILKLKSEIDATIISLGRRAGTANKLMEKLYSNPIIDSISDVARFLGVTIKVANNLVNDLQNKGILKEITGNSRNRIFVFIKYLDLFR